MSTLILTLPSTPGDAQTRYSYALTADGQAVAAHAWASASGLPTAGVDDIVAVVPAAALSWHQVELPKGLTTNSPRLRSALQSLLEDRLLDEPEHMHLALEPAPRPGQPVWVAACQRAWLTQHLQTLEAAGRAANRIVPEFAPHAEPLRLVTQGEAQQARLVLTGSDAGVISLPLHSDTLALALGQQPLPEDATVLAEPAVAALTEQLLGRKARLQQAAETAVQAAQSPWDLAQFDLVNTGRTRAAKRMGGLLRQLWHAPEWRPARWGVAVLLLAQVLGLNLWAWQTQNRWQAQRQQMDQVLLQTFPQVKVVVDAPVQMGRELAQLRLASGASSGRDLEAMLSAVGNALPPGRSATALDYSNGELQLKGLNLSASEAEALTERLRPQGYRSRSEGSNQLLIQQDATP